MSASTNQLATGKDPLAITEELSLAAVQLDKIAELSLNATDQGFLKVFQTASAIEQLRAILTDEVMKPIMSLMGSPLGFRTDKDREKDKYPMAVVRECMISGVLKGCQMTGNQINIISSRDYITKEGFTYLLKKIEGLTYSMEMGLANARGDKGAIVNPKITWEYRGKKGEKTLELAIRVNAGMGHDAIMGKAERKAKCWLYNEITGNNYTDADAEDLSGPSPAPNMRDATPPKGRTPKGEDVGLDASGSGDLFSDMEGGNK